MEYLRYIIVYHGEFCTSEEFLGRRNDAPKATDPPRDAPGPVLVGLVTDVTRGVARG